MCVEREAVALVGLRLPNLGLHLETCRQRQCDYLISVSGIA